MFCQIASMQLSGANLLIASQQTARAEPKPPAGAQAPFAKVLAKDGGVEGAAFEPMQFRPASGPAKALEATSPAVPKPSTGGPTRPGAHLDIRV
jgi:hypothetical protein